MMPRPTFASILALCALFSCAVELHAQQLELPATFRGDLPCSDCAGVKYHLDLWPDHVFHLRRDWSGARDVRDEIGRWRIDAERRVLLLEGGAEMPLQFAVESPRVLQVLDLEGKPLPPSKAGSLRSDGRMEPLVLSLFMGGEIKSVDGQLLFDECLTGRTYAIASGSEAQRLDQEYRSRMQGRTGALYVTFDGTLQPDTLTLRNGTTRAIVAIDRFVGAWPDQACARARADAALANTYWRIVQLQGQPATTAAGEREPHLLLRQADSVTSFDATAGCNEFKGRWQHSSHTIAFEYAANTPKSCPEPLAATEQRLQQMLDLAAGWRRTGNVLVLEDAQGAPLALLEAVYFR
jgi:copper homeostasis protein (lipoprotein)